jgi:nitroimidazol reductase NimA-like FMN-containing flavoprotein (pyridoxamine 5'-phosphate oxidase superfamily)
MRRKDKEIIDFEEIEAILTDANVCRIAMVDEGCPYIVPMNYGYGNGCIYLHSAPEGKKIDLLRKNPDVCFEIDTDVEIMKSDKACNFSTRYRCIIGYGTIEFLQDIAEKETGMKVLLRHITSRDDWEIPAPMLAHVAVMRLNIKEMSGKKSGI